jgi:CheY-like chemotaxis protein
MARVCLFHWNAEEARPLLTVLQAAGHSVELRGQMASYREVRERPPDAIVVDLSRLPSHGRELAVYFRGSKSTRHVPIVFVEGEPEKVERVRKLLPDAVYTPLARLRGAVKSALANPPANPVKAAQMMDRWGHRTTTQKLGIAKDSRVAVIEPPSGYAQAIGELPEGATFDEESTEDCTVSLWFVHGVPEFHSALPRMRKLAARTRLWILWRKNKRDGLDGNLIRAGCVAVGLVDYKICSINDAWSGMVFAVKKSSELLASKPARTARRTRSPADD